MKNNQGNAPATTIETQPPDQPDEGRPPSEERVDAYQHLLTFAQRVEATGKRYIELEQDTEGLNCLWLGAQARYMAAKLDEESVQSQTLTGIEMLLEQLVQGRGY